VSYFKGRRGEGRGKTVKKREMVKGKGKREGRNKLGKRGKRKGDKAPQLKFLATPLLPQCT